jgi:hypothetical protein
MFALASTNAGFVSYAGLPYAASPLLTRAVPAISQFSHVDYNAIPAAYPVATSYAAHAVPAISQYSHVDYTAVPSAVHLASPYVAYSAPLAYHSAPATILAKAPATYTAQTRGAIHTAPLEGHELSQTSLNVEPAPGTW